MEQGRGTAGLNHGMVENAIALGLRQCGVGHLVHADGQPPPARPHVELIAVLPDDCGGRLHLDADAAARIACYAVPDVPPRAGVLTRPVRDAAADPYL